MSDPENDGADDPGEHAAGDEGVRQEATDGGTDTTGGHDGDERTSGGPADDTVEVDGPAGPETDRVDASEGTPESTDEGGPDEAPADGATDEAAREESAAADPDAERGDEARPAAGTATLFEVLGNERRRHVIQVLRDGDGPMALSDLADAVAARENGVAPEALTRRQRKSTYTALQQTHLPKMDEAGVLTFDKSAGEVTPGDTIVEYTLYLDVVPSMGVRRSEAYLAVAGFGALVTLGVLLALPPFTWLGPLAWAALTVAAFAAVAVVQLYHHPLFPERFGTR